MKRVFRFLGCTALAAWLLTGCNSEETLIDNSAPPVEKGKVSFILPIGANSIVTYANPVQGKPAEYALHNIRIYWFTDDNNKFFKIFGWGDGTIAGGMDSPEPTIPNHRNSLS